MPEDGGTAHIRPIYSMDRLRRTIAIPISDDETSNNNLREAGEYAQATLAAAIHNIGKNFKGEDPIRYPTDVERELVNYGAAAFFYQLSNGDETMLDKYREQMIPDYIKGRFGRPHFRVSRPL